MNNIEKLLEQIDDSETRYSIIETFFEKGIFPPEKLSKSLKEALDYDIKINRLSRYRDAIREFLEKRDFERAEKFLKEYIEDSEYAEDFKEYIECAEDKSPIEIYWYSSISYLTGDYKEKEMLKDLEKRKKFEYAAEIAEELELKEKAEAYRKIHELLSQ